MSFRAYALGVILSGALVAACRSSPVAVPVCSNGVVETGEDCDGTDLGDATCSIVGFAGGTLSCSDTCKFDTDLCVITGDCGNGQIEGNEDCEDTDLGGATCASEGHGGGTLACGNGCIFDTSGCCVHMCAADGITQCTGDIIDTCSADAAGCLAWTPGTDCAASGDICATTSGTATCVASEPVCDNGEIEPGEDCEGIDLAGADCAGEGYTGGTLACGNGCAFDTSGCCTDACTASDTQCNGDLIEPCNTGALGCLEWTGGADCASTGEFCDDSSGTAVCACGDNCDLTDLPRCGGDVIEDCAVQANGCNDWRAGVDCTQTGEVCYDASIAAACIAAVGEDCFSAVTISVGANTVEWTGVNQDYLTTKPSCVTSGIPTGADIVLEYIAAFDGFVDFTLDKDAFNRLVMVVSDAACGVVTELLCVSDFSGTTMGGTISVVDGTAYYLYLVDTTSGTGTLPKPVSIMVTETLCVDTCPVDGAMRCTGDAIETCEVNFLGCLEWNQTSDCTASSKFCNAGSGLVQCLPCQDTCPALNDSQCTGDNIESCSLQPSGCTDWARTLDCSTIALAVCDDTMGAAACVLSTGEDCSSSYILTGGVNTVNWTATNSDYLLSTPACVTSGSVTGPDIVLRYTAILDGYIDISMTKPTSTRYAMVVSDAPCGTVTFPRSCISDYSNSVMGDIIAVTLGTTYYFYLSDTTSGDNSLENPFDLTVTDLACIDTCSNDDASRCVSDVVETCMTSPLGCLAWLPTKDCAATGGVCEASGDIANCIACRDNCLFNGLGQCTGDTVQTCTVNSLGCLNWLTGANCTSLGEVCFESGGIAGCAALAGEDCNNTWVLNPGANTISWVAFNRDYLTLAPSCQSSGSVSGPDVVLQYTAQNTGYVDMVMDKPTDERYSFVVSDAACGTVSPEVACVSNRTAATMTGTFAVTSGVTYYVYVVDTTNGTAPLVSPFDFGVYETTCPGGMAGNACGSPGATGCQGFSIFTRTPAASIPDSGGNATTCGGGSSFVADVITTTQTDIIIDVNIGFDITHTWDSDLDIFIQFVDSTATSYCVELSTDNGSSSNDYTNTLFDDEATTLITAGSAPFTGTFIPEDALSTFDGLMMNGTWTLYVSDDTGGATGTLENWSLTIEHGGGTVIQNCTLEPSGCLAWTPGTDCGDTGDWCAAASGTARCLPCQDSCPIDGITQCNGDILETCAVDATGCYKWTVPLDCSIGGDFCDATSGIPACVTPLGEDCTNLVSLALGPNTISWAAINQDYLITTPTCQTTGSPVGPDVVMEYTANFDGQVRFDIAKPAGMRYSAVVSDDPCGTVTELACVSDVSGASMGSSFAVSDGVTYTFYVTDADSGSDPLVNPLTVTLACINTCTAGAERCNGDMIQSCLTNAGGCLSWLDTTDCSDTGDTCDPGGGTPVCAICTDLCPTANDTRCTGATVETCAPGFLGCLEWSMTSDCSIGGGLCEAGSGTPSCYVPVAEDCSSTVVLSQGINTINWIAFFQDYMSATPACQTSGTTTGPDLVFEYTAAADGFLDLQMDKLGSQRFTFVVSDAPCGTLTPEVACVSDFSSTSMGSLFQIVGGTTYYIYVTDSTFGSAPLVNPMTFTLFETSCPSGAAGDLCPGESVGRCSGVVTVPRMLSLAIPDNGGNATTCGSVAASAVDSIVITQTDVIADVDIGVDITHVYDGDLDIFVEFVDATSTSHCVELSTNNGGSGNNYSGTIFDDEATVAITAALAPMTGRFIPESPLSAFDGLPMNGTWTIYVSDDAGPDAGTLNAWLLDITLASGTIIDTCTVQPSGCLAWQSDTDCSSLVPSEFCNAGSGTARCLPCQDTCPLGGAKRCVGDVIEDCAVNTQGCYDWVTGVDCAPAGLCDDSSGSAACVLCIDSCLPANDTQCNGTVIEDCNIGILGCLEWLPGTDCNTTSQDCDASSGTAVCVACSSSCSTPWATQCAVEVVETRAPATAIPDSGGNATTCGGAALFASDVITVAKTDPINDLDVTINVSHTWVDDLDIFLELVDNTGTPHCVELTTDNGGSSSDYIDTVFDDEAATSITSGSAPFTGSFQPETPLSDLDGLPMKGTYTLYLSDDIGGDTGTLNSWSLRIGYGTGMVIETCTVQPNGCMNWTAGTDCAIGGGFCDDSSGSASCAACLDNCAAVGNTRCNGAVIEDCTLGILGCFEWVGGVDCDAINPGDFCDDSSGTAVCMMRLGEDCNTPYPLTFGVNVVRWFASNADYITASPSCQIWGTPTGPDVVLEYTADYTGQLDIIIDKPATNTQTFIVSDAACGTLTPELSCASEWFDSTMQGTIPVTLGSIYYFYIIDSTDGSASLADPMTVTLACADSCTTGAQRCAGDRIETCQTDSFGCLSWQWTTDCAVGSQTCDDFFGPPACADCTNFCAAAGNTQCNADVIETCSPDGLGCLYWQGGTNCSVSGDVCIDTSGTVSCERPVGEDCTDTFVLSQGVNVIAWTAANLDYLTTRPSCSSSNPDGPDVVAKYTATSTGDGFINVVMDKPTSTRYAMVVSSAACGTIAELACFSEYTNPTMGGTFAMIGGTTYYFYVVDTTSGSNPLPNPFTLTINESDCVVFSAAPSNEIPLTGSSTASLQPVLSVDFDAAIDTTVGIINISGDAGTNLIYTVDTDSEVFFTNDDTTMNIDPGIAFPPGEQVSVTWFGLRDLICGSPISAMTWDFVIATPTCTPGVGGMVGTGQTRFATSVGGFNEQFVAADDDPAGWVYFGGTDNLYRSPKAGGMFEDVEVLAGLTTAQMGYAMLIVGSDIFTLDSTTSSAGRLWRISTDGGLTWSVEDFAGFAVNPADDFRAVAHHGGRIYMVTEEVSTGIDTEIWSVSLTAGTLPDPANLEIALAERDCNAMAMDSSFYYLACASGERVVRVDRFSSTVDLLTTTHDLSSTVNALHAHDLGVDGIADVLYLQIGSEEVFYFCDPSTAPFTDRMLTYGGATTTTNRGLGFDVVGNTLWAYDDDVQELIQIQ